MKSRLILVAAILASSLPLNAQRVERTVNSNWQFTQFDTTVTVNVPHTWNAIDAQDEVLGYYQGTGLYRKKFTINEDLAGKEIFVRFEAVFQTAVVKVNGVKVGEHHGGYTAFCYDITPFVHQGENEFEINVSNRKEKYTAPSNKGDFTKFGGIYRDVELIVTSKAYISPVHYASRGVYLTTPSVSAESSEVESVTYLGNAGDKPLKLVLEQTIFAPTGEKVAESRQKVKLPAASVNVPFSGKMRVSACRLWDFDHPEVYKVLTVLKTDKGEELDHVESPLGFRSFEFDPDRGFSINGSAVKLIGTSHHQDYLRMGNALTDEMMARDMRQLKELGANYLRISHYPQDEVLSQMCDHLGIGTSIEIPMVNSVTLDDRYLENGIGQLREMIYQNFNNPSVLVWAYMNEILIGGEKDDPKWGPMTKRFAQTLDDECHRIDPYRKTMIACHNNPRLYKEEGVGEVPDIVGINIYYGWYGKLNSELTERLYETHRLFPRQAILISEYGGGSDPRLHSDTPERFDFSIEHQTALHKPHIKVIRDSAFIAGANVWNYADFYSYKRFDAVPYVNSKGLVTLDRKKKDSYFLYQAALLRKPFLQIGSPDWKFRAGNEGQLHNVPVFTNAPEVALYLNGKFVGREIVKDYEASFRLAFAPGVNRLVAKAEGCVESMIEFEYNAVRKGFRDFVEMNVSIGDPRMFEDRKSGTCYLPDQDYVPGSWGCIGGKQYRQNRRGTKVLGTDSDIIGTYLDPVFQTQRVGIEAFKADLPDGEYYIYLDFAELFVEKTMKYVENLGMDGTGEKEVERIFSIDINGLPVLKSFNIRAEEGAERAVEKRFKVVVRDGKGLTVTFKPEKNLPVLNGIRIYKSI